MTATGLSISAKNLGGLAMADACPRCFWLKTHMHFKLPWQIFPGIFSSIDCYTKKVTNLNHAKHGRLPAWLEQFCGPGAPIKVPGYSRFCMKHTETGVTLPNGFSMDFTAKVLPIEMDSGLVPALLAKAKDIFEMPEPSESRDGCRDCGMVGELMRLELGA